ncbi:MAG: cell division protein Fic [Bacteroidota bacterium]|nr:MAG: cell division protein Fic [Bacteroidota bacterium]HNS29675.1 mobile mystery protein B [Tenuifilaceae bacterium]
MGLDFELVNGQTPLDEEEKDGLLIPTIVTRGELDEFEQLNIEKAIQWTLTRKFKKDDILTEDFVKLVHKKMYGDVWAWAGEFRKANKNIGVDRYQVVIELRKLIGDCSYWIDHGTYPPDEIAVRFKHRIVSIHCFSNGNGRHSRLMGDLIIEKIFGESVFTWGANADLTKTGDTRKEYLDAVKTADRNDFRSLLEFARK